MVLLIASDTGVMNGRCGAWLTVACWPAALPADVDRRRVARRRVECDGAVA